MGWFNRNSENEKQKVILFMEGICHSKFVIKDNLLIDEINGIASNYERIKRIYKIQKSKNTTFGAKIGIALDYQSCFFCDDPQKGWNEVLKDMGKTYYYIPIIGRIPDGSISCINYIDRFCWRLDNKYNNREILNVKNR